jgi:hypothetical protein
MEECQRKRSGKGSKLPIYGNHRITCWTEGGGLTGARALLEKRAVFLDEKKRCVV